MSSKILFIGAHHEEIEAECPNTAAALAMAGCEVTILNPIGGWNWLFIQNLEGNGRERTIQDANAAAQALGCKKVIWDYPVAKQDRFQAEIMDRMADFLMEYNPDIVFMHWPKDEHADHRLIAHITRHILHTAPNISEKRYPDYHYPKEIYAFQTGPSQAYHFIPDLLVKTDDESMTRSEKCVNCFLNTAPDMAKAWQYNYKTKAQYWGNLCGHPAEALKFIGPALPLEGFLLKKILGERLVSAPLETYFYNADFQL